ncbi:Unknown protein, partial [Striga hermonthica]
MELNIKLTPLHTPLFGFNGSEVAPLGETMLAVVLGEGDLRKVKIVRVVVVDVESDYNGILGRPALNAFQIVVSTYHMKLKFPVGDRVGEARGDQKLSRTCYQIAVKSNQRAEIKEGKKPMSSEKRPRGSDLELHGDSKDGRMGNSITTMHFEGSVLGEAMEFEEKDDWRKSIRELLQGRVPMGDKQDAEKVARYLSKYFEVDGIMFKKSLVGPHLRCVSEEEGTHVLKEIHEGCCGAHIGSRALAGKALRAGYYWPKIRAATEQLVQKCERCQRHGQITHIPAENMTKINTPIPFAQWGIELVGPLPMGTGQRKFLVVAVDYFSKW